MRMEGDRVEAERGCPKRSRRQEKKEEEEEEEGEEEEEEEEEEDTKQERAAREHVLISFLISFFPGLDSLAMSIPISQPSSTSCDECIEACGRSTQSVVGGHTNNVSWEIEAKSCGPGMEPFQRSKIRSP